MQGTKVLVVDDSTTVRGYCARALTRAGFSVVEACDGQDALDRLEQEPSVVLVLCDLHMPRMSGFDFLERKSSDPRISQIPAIVVTTEGRSELVAQAKSLGAKGWIVKPFDAEKLVTIVKRFTAPPPQAEVVSAAET